MLSRRETKILATLGTASATPDMMRTLIREGVDGFRINMSHMRAEELDGWVRLARSAAAAEGAPVAVAVFFAGADTLYGRYWGAAEALHSLHFEACYHQGVELALERG